MKKEQYYFKKKDSEICRNKAYFDTLMEERGLEEMEVYEAHAEIIGGGVFWCKIHAFCGDGTADICGKSNCDDYEPRNKISGVCKHHTHWLYTAGEKVVLKKDLP